MSLSLSLGSTPGFGSLNAYWGQKQGYELRSICDSGVQYATVSFVTKSPENAIGGYPATNFGANCADAVFSVGDKKTELLSGCSFIKRDIPYCQAKGVKVLLSIGGALGENTNYHVSTPEKGVEFADFLYHAFGPSKSSWDGPRPFGDVAVDGFDLDLEDSTVAMAPYIAMVDYWRKQSDDLYITAAPQCPTYYNDLDILINSSKLDALFIQFYNNPVCDAIPNNTPGDQFSYDKWVSRIQAGKSKNAKLFIGLPGSTDAATTGYITPKELKDLVCQHKGKSNFGGVSLWDGKYALDNKDSKGKSYMQAALDALKYGCNEVPTTTSTTAKSTQATTSTSSKPTVTTTKEVVTTTTSTEKHDTTTKSASTSVPAISSTSLWSNSTTTTAKHVSQTTSNVQVTNSASTSKPVVISSTAHWSNSTTTTKPVSYTTSTVCTTKTYTITSCAPTVTNCPKGHVTTETIPLYTTVCPVTESTKPTTTKAPVMTTSTVYATKTYTITSCPPYVADCPKGKITTSVVPVYTTVCPVKETETGEVPQPTNTKTATTIVYSTVKVHRSSSLETSVRSTADVPKPSSEGCSGPGCPGATSTSGSGCTGSECPSVVVPTNSATSPPGSGCTGPECPGVAIPTNSWTSSPVGPSATPSGPVTAGASTLAFGLTGLVVMVAAQVLAM
ncbi:Chitinase 2 [Conoideocrella luteorostrata]|uniref:Chitinase 2 n=1 Tax=Conoideocrella luteorostrata TaxID=1105319 RepID=A0AAJ0CY44_9HYPO|nr:Chitinase 2 [Conoideocrella luteorostrata]